MSKTPIAHGSLTVLAAAVALLTSGCAGTADGAEAGGCRDNGGWSARERAGWLRPAVSFHEGATGGDAAVVIGPHGTDDGGPLCKPVTVQVEFWRVTATASGTGLRSALRIRLDTDGGKDRRTGFPAGLAAGERDDCTGVLMAAYVDEPLADTELPEITGDLASAGETEVKFGTDRVGAYRLVPPSAPETCDEEADRDGATDADPTTAPPDTTNPWGPYHP